MSFSHILQPEIEMNEEQINLPSVSNVINKIRTYTEFTNSQVLCVELLEISTLKGKLTPSFSKWKELADNSPTGCFLLRISYSLS